MDKHSNQAAGKSDAGNLRFVSTAVSMSLLVLYGVSSFLRYIGNDDYETLYLAWLKAIGRLPGVELQTAYYLQPNLLVPVMHWFPGTLVPLYVGRLATVCVLALVCLMGARLAATTMRGSTATLAPIITLLSGGILYRGLDLRPDPLSALLWMTTLVVVLGSPYPAPRRTYVKVGVLVGLCLVNREKATMVAGVAFPLLFVLEWRFGTLAEARRRFSDGCLWALAGAASAFAAYVALLAFTDDLPTYLQTTRAQYANLPSYGSIRGQTVRTLRAAVAEDPGFWLLAAVGLVVRSVRVSRHTFVENAGAGAILGLAMLSVAVNPAYEVYNLTMLQPLLAVFCAYPLALAVDRIQARPWLQAAVWTTVVLVMLLARKRPLAEALADTMSHQRSLHQFLMQHLGPHESVLAWEGVGLYRPSVAHWRLPFVTAWRHYMFTREFSYATEAAKARPSLVVTGYRTRWLNQGDREYLRRRYVTVRPFVAVAGWWSEAGTGTEVGDLLVGGAYAVRVPRGGWCSVDGERWQAGEVRHLAAGNHQVEHWNGQCVLFRHYSEEALGLLDNPSGRPYLVPPLLESIDRYARGAVEDGVLIPSLPPGEPPGTR